MAIKRFSPSFVGPIEGYVVNHLKRNFWRLQATMEYIDAMQEAQLVFLKLVSAYPKIKTPQHFMALFKTAWHRRFTDLANLDTYRRHEVTDSSLDESAEAVGRNNNYRIGDLDNDGMLAIMIQQAPEEVQRVLALFLVAPAEILELALASWRLNGHNVPAGNKMLCRMLGFESGTDVIGMVEKYFRS